MLPENHRLSKVMKAFSIALGSHGACVSQPSMLLMDKGPVQEGASHVCKRGWGTSACNAPLNQTTFQSICIFFCYHSPFPPFPPFSTRVMPMALVCMHGEILFLRSSRLSEHRFQKGVRISPQASSHSKNNFFFYWWCSERRDTGGTCHCACFLH